MLGRAPLAPAVAATIYASPLRPEICGPSAFGYSTVGWVDIAIASRVATGYCSLLFGKVVGGRASSRCTAARNEFSPIWTYRALRVSDRNGPASPLDGINTGAINEPACEGVP